MTRPILKSLKLGFPWETIDPFLFCVHHEDAYPAGNEAMGPTGSLAGRELGQDFVVKDGFRMYHGEVVPGFPAHPHRGFETVTVMRSGFVDHSDSLGATARFGAGDVQWMTAGAGIVHAEMFPLRERGARNPLELFQIWINLPRADKMAEPYFAMLWAESVPVVSLRDGAGRVAEVTAIAGRVGDRSAPSPPPRSWASRADADVAIWSVRFDASAQLTFPAAKLGTRRAIYFFRGASLAVGGHTMGVGEGAEIRCDAPLLLENGASPAEVLVLQGRPIGEPVVQYGPFVMNTQAEIRETFADYQRTRFGGWPWPSSAPVHPREAGRFAKHADGRVEHAPNYSKHTR